MNERDARVEAAAKALRKSFAEDEGYAAPVGVKEWGGMARAALAAADAVQGGDDLTAEDAVCACLDETGGRQVELLERCLRCGALMRHDPPADDRRMVDRQESLYFDAVDELVNAAWLIGLKDGPRDHIYRSNKDRAWSRLRNALREFGGSAPSEADTIPRAVKDPETGRWGDSASSEDQP